MTVLNIKILFYKTNPNPQLPYETTTLRGDALSLAEVNEQSD
jgi:hypothetical protein